MFSHVKSKARMRIYFSHNGKALSSTDKKTVTFINKEIALALLSILH